MKRLMTTVCGILVLLLSVFCGCQKEEDLIVDKVPATVYSREELFELVQSARQKQSNGEQLSQDEEFVVDLQEIPSPVIDTSEYALIRIVVSQYHIRYYYCPVSELETAEGETGDFDLWRSEYLAFSYSREVYFGEDPLDGIAEQVNVEVNSEGVIYDESKGQIFFRYGLSSGDITATESLNHYDILFPLCQYEVITIPDA